MSGAVCGMPSCASAHSTFHPFCYSPCYLKAGGHTGRLVMQRMVTRQKEDAPPAVARTHVVLGRGFFFV